MLPLCEIGSFLRMPKLLVLVFLIIGGILGPILWLRSCNSGTLPTAGGRILTESHCLAVPHLRQNDPAWSADKLGETHLTLGAAGCAVACVAMVFSYHGASMNPQELNNQLTTGGGYTEKGWIIWEKCLDAANGRMRLSYIGSPRFDLIDMNLERGNPVIVKVPLPGNVPHWVVVCGKEGEEYLVNDPLRYSVNPIRLSEVGAHMTALRIYEKVHYQSRSHR